jgi:DNA-binding response OmpR family regulator
MKITSGGWNDMSKLIYIADDEINIRNLIQSFLVKEGYRVESFENGDMLFSAHLQNPCDLVILDVVMPGSSGFVVCMKLREISNVPIIMLTARDTDEDYISGMSLGSDDYFTKPFSPVKLVIRVKAMFRRIEMNETNKTNMSESQCEEIISYGDISMYADKLQIFCNDTNLNVTNKEFALLEYLLNNQDKAVSRDELLSDIWGYESIVETRVTDDTVKRIRRKLSSANSQVSIDTVWGHGFRIAIKDVEQ